MKQLLLTLFIFLTAIVVNAQSFEGKITYKNTYKSKNPGLGDTQLTSLMGDTQQYYIKGGNYRSDINGSLLQSQLYINQDNKLYTKMSNNENILFNDALVNNDEVLSAIVTKNTTTILGYKCEELVITTKNGIQKYYFASKLAVDAKLYTNHKYGNWDVYMANAHAMPLKITMNTPQFSMESLAVEVKSSKLQPELFILPKDIPIVKSPN